MTLTVSKDLLEELNHLAEVADESREDLELDAAEEEALDSILELLKSRTFTIPENPDVLSWIGQFLEDITSKITGQPDAKKLLIECRGVMVQLGMYRVITEEELSHTIVSHGKAYSFKLAGVKYVFDKHL